VETTVAAAMLGAALLHATWHAMVKSSGDQVTALAGMNLVSGATAMVLMPFVGLPSPAAAAVIALSVLLHVGYKVALARLYVSTELSIAYPVARGLTPAIATLLAFLLVGERPGMLATLGILAISLGIFGLVLGRAAPRMPQPALIAAAAAGSAAAMYSVLDAYGVRINGDWLGFTVWLVASDSLAFVGYALATRGRAAPAAWRRGWGRTVVSGLLGTASFGVFLWALGQAQVGPVTALRETSIVFAALIGMAFLGEPPSARTVTSTVIVMLGAAAIALAR
jgi:drug/metabolite transporter (DMT)-like permease